jgi:hypothetical protein
LARLDIKDASRKTATATARARNRSVAAAAKDHGVNLKDTLRDNEARRRRLDARKGPPLGRGDAYADTWTLLGARRERGLAECAAIAH